MTERIQTTSDARTLRRSLSKCESIQGTSEDGSDMQAEEMTLLETDQSDELETMRRKGQAAFHPVDDIAMHDI